VSVILVYRGILKHHEPKVRSINGVRSTDVSGVGDILVIWGFII